MTEETVEVIKTMEELSEDTNEKADELSKVIQNTTDQFTKELRVHEKFQSEILVRN